MRFLPELLSRNWTLKLAALGFAVLLWTAVRVEAPDRQPLPGIPVRVQLSDPDYALAGEPLPSTVELRVGGPARALFQLALDPPTLVVPVDEVTSPDTTVVLRRDWIRLQDRPGVVVEDIQPSQVRLSFEPIETVAVPLAITTRGDLDPDLALAARLSTDPPVVRLSGSRSRVLGLDSVRLSPVELDEIQDPGTHRLEQAVDSSGLAGLSLSPARATVTVRVEEVRERTVGSVPVVLEDGGEQLEVEPSVLDVTLRGARSLVESGDSISLTLSVPGEALEDLQEERWVTVQIGGLPDLVRAIPAADSVLVRRRQSP